MNMKLIAITALILLMYISCFLDIGASWVVLGAIVITIFSSVKYVK
jgi:hypothetical protein